MIKVFVGAVLVCGLAACSSMPFGQGECYFRPDYSDFGHLVKVINVGQYSLQVINVKGETTVIDKTESDSLEPADCFDSFKFESNK